MKLNPHYVTDPNGKRLSVILPIDEFLELLDQAEEPQPEELAESSAAWQAWLEGDDQGEPLDQVRRELLHE